MSNRVDSSACWAALCNSAQMDQNVVEVIPFEILRLHHVRAAVLWCRYRAALALRCRKSVWALEAGP